MRKANGSVAILLGNGDGTFQAPVEIADGGAFGGAPLAVGDLNQDGIDDLVVGQGGGGSIFLSAPIATLAPASVNFGSVVLGSASLDRSVLLTNNGNAPLVLANVAVTGNFGLDNRCPKSLRIGSVCQINISFAPIVFGDNSGSLLLTDDTMRGQQSVALSANVIPGPFARFGITSPNSTTAGNSVSFNVTAKDALGNVIPSYNGTVHFSSSDPSATLPGDYTFNSVIDQGVHAFQAVLRLAGNERLTASDVFFSTLKGSTEITVNPAAATFFTVAAPVNATRTKSFSVSLAARDPFSNIASGYMGTVHFTSSDTAANLPNDYAFTTADGGVHSFAMTLNTLGQQTIVATDAANGSVTGSANVDVLHLSATGKSLRVRLGQPFSLLMASFTDEANPTLTSLSAMINWGDGIANSGIVQSDGLGGYTVLGSHTYLSPPEHNIALTIQDSANGFGPLTLIEDVRMWPFTVSH